MIGLRGLLAALLIAPVLLAAQSADIAVDGRMHHLRSGQAREWASFPAADVEGSGEFDSAFAQAERLVTGSADFVDLARRLSGYDRAVAAQAASLLRARDPAGFPTTVRRLLETATFEVAEGLREYLRVVSADLKAGGSNLY